MRNIAKEIQLVKRFNLETVTINGGNALSTSKRMSKIDRRKQLLQTALTVVREEGIEALTLANLAERAGVTKPITYEHFGTRAGLLIALFRDHDDQTTRKVNAALSARGKSLEDVGAILSTTYIDSCLSMGSEISAVYKALSASQETEGFKQTWRAFLVDEFHKALATFVKLPNKKLKTLLLGIIGAAEILAEAATAGRISRIQAITTLSSITIGALENAQEPKV
jgi:AcrR family transcriptional regulator